MAGGCNASLDALADGTRPPLSCSPAAYDVFTDREYAARRAFGAGVCPIG